MPKFTAEQFIALIALLIVGALAFHMVYVPIPAQNHDYLVFLLGALTSALSIGGGMKAIDTLKANTINTTVTSSSDMTEPPP